MGAEHPRWISLSIPLLAGNPGFRCCRLAGMKFQLRRSAAFNSTLEPFSAASRERSRLLSRCRQLSGLLATPCRQRRGERGEKSEEDVTREREKETTRRRKKRRGGRKRRRRKRVKRRSREIKTELNVFQAVYRESARGKSPMRTSRRQLYLQNNLTVP